MYRRTSTFSGATLLLLASGSFAVAQPGFGPPSGPRGPGDFGGPPIDMMRMHPVLAALDADGDGQISQEEIANATAALNRLDTNQDSKLTIDELRPDFRRDTEERRPDGRGPDARGPEGRGPRDGGPGDRVPEGRRPRDRGPEDRGPEGRGPEGRGPGDRGPEGRGPGDRGPEGRGPRGGGPGDRGPGDRGPGDRGPEGRGPEGRGPEDRGPGDRGPEGRGPEGRGPEGRGPEGRGPGVGPRDPEQFIKRAFEFDADEDGKLSKEELTEMFKAMGRGRDEGREPKEKT